MTLLVCAATIIVNNTKSWTETDKRSLSYAKTRCEQIYKDAPCLKKFTKKEELVYQAICGKKT